MKPMISKLVLIGALIGFPLLFFMLAQIGTVSGAEAKQLVSTGARLIDVRTSAEFNAGHLPGAVNIPVTRIEERAAEIGDKASPIVVYCRSGSRSARAKRILESEGFTNVNNLGAMSRWP